MKPTSTSTSFGLLVLFLEEVVSLESSSFFSSSPTSSPTVVSPLPLLVVLVVAPLVYSRQVTFSVSKVSVWACPPNRL
eukprot:CAMPEP_0201939294 /NCGR_PEP_ID=MMETSP0903-20130614/42923_1 /ASSEMBLY_ACC=CAM_ASM_000552 /TAXON_ID=420261 /ORGANISM="Thalassiosira antarctica, Strain CCMP982" /LENGTH=77 /DNA_ID=CAMNT_0048480789 /DNA_START=16 /DNA_END=245 /DNA_ORIENTATION=-